MSAKMEMARDCKGRKLSLHVNKVDRDILKRVGRGILDAVN